MRRLPFLSQADRRALLLLEWVVLLVVVGLALYGWRSPQGDEGEAASFAQSDSTSGRKHSVAQSYTYATPEEPVETFTFDPNTADSTVLLRLGLAPWQVRAIYHYRAKHGRYHTPEDFKRLPGMTYELWERLGPYVRIDRRFQYLSPQDRQKASAESSSSGLKNNEGHSPSGSASSKETRKGEDSSASGGLAGERLSSERTTGEGTPSSSDTLSSPMKKEGQSDKSHSSSKTGYLAEERDTILYPIKYDPGTVIDLNQADTSMLKKIPGIASYRAGKIVEYRQKLGGFRNKEQVMEACKMPDEVLEWFTVSPVPLQRLDVNHLSLQRLMRHPYITFYQARAIVEYRNKFGALHGIQDLQNLEGFTPQNIERVKDYLEFK